MGGLRDREGEQDFQSWGSEDPGCLGPLGLKSALCVCVIFAQRSGSWLSGACGGSGLQLGPLLWGALALTSRLCP